MGIHPIGRIGRTLPVCALFLCSLAWHVPLVIFAQVIGEHAELERLRIKADEAIANGDPDGAAMNSGKAALMAAQLAKREGDNSTGDWYRGAEALFRSQEHGYRALALFQRAGGNPPASTGVCQSLQLADLESQRASTWFGKRSRPAADTAGTSAEPPLTSISTEWHHTVEQMRKDFQCS